MEHSLLVVGKIYLSKAVSGVSMARSSQKALMYECIAELIGTWMLVFIGTATVASAVATGAQAGIWQVAVVWGLGVALSIIVAAPISGAHLNPAVTIAMGLTLRSRFPRSKILPYILAQTLGATCSGLTVLLLFGSALQRYEQRHAIVRGQANSTLSAMAFGQYFPNPQVVSSAVLDEADVDTATAYAIEALGTFVLMLVIRVLSDEHHSARPGLVQAACLIGGTVAMIISFVAPLTQAGLNPARDFGPRLVAALAGWSDIALPGPRGEVWVYILGPIAGALVASVLYNWVLEPAYAYQHPHALDHPSRVDAEQKAPNDVVSDHAVDPDDRTGSPASQMYHPFADSA